MSASAKSICSYIKQNLKNKNKIFFKSTSVLLKLSYVYQLLALLFVVILIRFNFNARSLPWLFQENGNI